MTIKCQIIKYTTRRFAKLGRNNNEQHKKNGSKRVGLNFILFKLKKKQNEHLPITKK